MSPQPTFREYLRLWFKHYNDPITIFIWLFFRPYRYRWATSDFIKDAQAIKLYRLYYAVTVVFVSAFWVGIMNLILVWVLHLWGAEITLNVVLMGASFGILAGGIIGMLFSPLEGIAFAIAAGVGLGILGVDVGGINVFKIALLGIVLGIIFLSAIEIIWGTALKLPLSFVFLIPALIYPLYKIIGMNIPHSVPAKISALFIGLILGALRAVDGVIWIIASYLAERFNGETPLSKFHGYLMFPMLWDYHLLYKKLRDKGDFPKWFKEDFKKGLGDGFEIAFNVFQRWIFQKGLKKILGELNPSKLLAILRKMRFEEFWREPIIPALSEDEKDQVNRFQAVMILLSDRNPEDFKGQDKNPFNFIPESSEAWAIRLTFPLMDRSNSLVTDLATAYHAMIFEGDRPGDHLYAFYRAKNMGIDEADELIWTYETLDKCLDCKDVSNIVEIIPELKKFDRFQQEFQPEVIEAFRFLWDIAVDARALHFATARVSKQEAGASALGKLEKLKSYVDEKLPEPERRYFLEIAELWRRLITKEAYELVERTKLEVIANPYPVGQPVTGDTFKGREYIFEKIKEKSLLDPILLHGHGRIGKTSIALNLTEKYLGPGYVSIYSSVQGHGSSEADILRHIARAFADKLRVKIPSLDAFSRMPRAAFDDVLGEAKLRRNGRFVIMVIDEFEEIEKSIRNGKIPVDFVDYLHNVWQENRKWLGLMLVGSHSLDEMTREYWNPFLGIIQPIKVGFMDHDEARRLITNPTEGDFPVKYEDEVIERIIQLTGGQPFLINKVCRAMVDELNRRIIKGGFTKYPILNAEYLRVALNEIIPDRTNYYFHALWNQIGDYEANAISALAGLMFRRLKKSPEDVVKKAAFEGIVQPCIKFDELRMELGWDEQRLESALRELAIHDVVKPMEGECKPLGCRDISLSKDKPFPKDACLCFCVPLTLPWLGINRLV